MSWWGTKTEEDTHSGEYGDLSETQQQVFEQFKDTIKQEKLTDSPRYDDFYLLKFCRARKFDLDKTVEMFKNFLNWREENKVDQAMVIYDCPNIPNIKRSYQHGYHAHDREGRPFYIERPCLMYIEEIFKIVPREELVQYYIREYEKFVHMRAPACSK